MVEAALTVEQTQLAAKTSETDDLGLYHMSWLERTSVLVAGCDAAAAVQTCSAVHTLFHIFTC